MGGLHTKFTIPCSKIFLEIEKYNPYFKNISCKKRFQKKRGELVRNNSPFLIPKYFQRQKSTIPSSISYKTCCEKKRGDFIQNSQFLHRKIQFLVQKHFLQKMLEKGGRGWICRTEFTVMLQKFRMWGQKNSIKTIEFCVTKYFLILQKMLEKKRGYVVQNSLLSYKISACGDREIQYKQQNSALQNISYKKCCKWGYTKIFPTENVAKS